MTIRRGFYAHYKGPVYFVTGVGVLHDQQRRIVAYESTQSAEDGIPRLRYEEEFEEFVYPDRGGEVYGLADPDSVGTTDEFLDSIGRKIVRRFRRINP